jgi:hypothetical protein
MKQKSSESKSVFFLGAGFTRDAGVPLQRQLLPGYLLLAGSNGRKAILKFLSDVYSFKYREPRSLNENDDLNTYPILEDVFSVLDNAVMNQEFLKDYSYHDLEVIREELVFGIMNLIDRSVENFDYVDRFAKALTDWRLGSDADDPFSIITTNWDIVLLNSLTVYHDSIIKKSLREAHASNLSDLESEIRKKLAIVDYCLYAHPLRDEKNHIPSLKIKPMGYRNVKYLFLHGSPTLLYCRKCRRIFTHPTYSKIRRPTRPSKKKLMRRRNCPVCTAPVRSSTSRKTIPTLSHMLIMPTYYKTIQNVHLLDVWQNAAMELQEANEVYFIGYSLPEADYLIRNLLVSNIRNTSKIYLQDYCGRSGKNYRQLFGNQIKRKNIQEGSGRDYVDELTDRIEEGEIS